MTAPAPKIHANLLNKSVHKIRTEIRAGRYDGQTSGLAMGRLQGNLVILPEAYALDFARFCQRNPRPCPVVAVSDTGDPALPTLGGDIDIRTDVPRYNVYRHGELTERRLDVRDIWQDNFVSFVLGCSFTFEDALIAAGIPIKHVAAGVNVAMYRTNRALLPAGPFAGEQVVSMRPIRSEDISRVCEITARFPHAHGAPLHMGDPRALGIDKIERPDWGDFVEIEDGEIPVFWACGVTPQAAVQRAKLPVCITHAPGCMLITDLQGVRADQGVSFDPEPPLTD